MWLENLGIKVNIQAMEWKVFLSSLRDDPDHRLNWEHYPDPDSLQAYLLKATK